MIAETWGSVKAGEIPVPGSTGCSRLASDQETTPILEVDRSKFLFEACKLKIPPLIKFSLPADHHRLKIPSKSIDFKRQERTNLSIP
jgi:hypothetical protein